MLIAALVKTARLSQTVDDNHLAQRGARAFVVILEDQDVITQEQAMITHSHLVESRSSKDAVVVQLRDALDEADVYGIELPKELLSSQ